MPVLNLNDQPGSHELPTDIRAGLEWIVVQNLTEEVSVPAALCGDASMIAAVTRYARLDGGADTLIALAAEQSDIERNITDLKPRRVFALTCGSFERALRPLRRTSHPLAPEVPDPVWKSLGYARISSVGFLGIGSLLLMLLERVLATTGRPDLADRCRVESLQGVEANGRFPRLATVTVHEYRAIQ